MFGKNRIDDAIRLFHAVITNQIARAAPRIYIKLTGQTGRGRKKETAQQTADYFRTCFYNYFQILKVAPDRIESYLTGKRILEYGPGDVPGVALLMLAHGAESVVCVDRFPMYSPSAESVEILQEILDSLKGKQRSRGDALFLRNGDIASGFASQRLRYLVHPSGLSGLRDTIDLIVSRAVLEHVDDLHATFTDMESALRSDGTAVHKVDLRSHGLHRYNSLDFLTWSPWLWSLMYSHKGYVNRLRIDVYFKAIENSGLRLLLMEPTAVAEKHEVEEIRPYLASPFRNISDEDLSCLSFWLVCLKEKDGKL